MQNSLNGIKGFMLQLPTELVLQSCWKGVCWLRLLKGEEGWGHGFEPCSPWLPILPFFFSFLFFCFLSLLLIHKLNSFLLFCKHLNSNSKLLLKTDFTNKLKPIPYQILNRFKWCNFFFCFCVRILFFWNLTLQTS